MTSEIRVDASSGIARPSEVSAPVAVLVASDAQFEGLITFRGDSRIDGSFRGEIAANGRLELGESSRVEAEIEADEVVLAGIFEGRVVAHSRLELLSTARVKGELSAPLLVAAEGCQVHGRCRTLESAEPAALQQSSS